MATFCVSTDVSWFSSESPIITFPLTMQSPNTPTYNFTHSKKNKKNSIRCKLELIFFFSIFFLTLLFISVYFSFRLNKTDDGMNVSRLTSNMQVMTHRLSDIECDFRYRISPNSLCVYASFSNSISKCTMTDARCVCTPVFNLNAFVSHTHTRACLLPYMQLNIVRHKWQLKLSA